MQCDYLMSAVLLIAASHINHYLPKDHPDRRPILQHFGSAISGLREDLDRGITSSNFDCIISCSILLVHYSWTYIDTDVNDNHDGSFLFRDTFALFRGVKECVMASYEFFINTVWFGVLTYKPRRVLERYIIESGPEDTTWDDTFNHCMTCSAQSRFPNGDMADDASSASRLIIVLKAIDISSPDIRSSGVSSDIYRYLFTWPTLCTRGFIQQVGENSLRSMKVLLYYYAAILNVSSDEIWWMRDRATHMYDMLRAKLEGHCDQCIRPAVALAERQRTTSWSYGSMY
jgi:hypothetical protein